MKSFHPYRLSLLLLLASFLLYSHSYIVIRSIHSTIIRHRILSLLNSNLDAYVSDDPYISVMIIPTGIGASIGGYAGDGLPSAKLLSIVSDILITHPNVINGASMYWPMNNVLYVEGFALDEFANNRLALKRLQKSSQRIGLLLDKAIEPELRIRHIQVADAARATLGINVADCIVTSQDVKVEVKDVTEGGSSWGSVGNTETLVEAAEALVAKGCTAIAVVVRFPEDEEGDEETVQKQVSSFQQYRLGEGVDRIAGAEAIISHVITKKLMIPCAHAPAFAPSPPESGISPKACAEEIGYTFLPCVLSYLHRAPSLITLPCTEQVHGLIRARDVDSVIVPANALGGAAVLAFISQGTLIIAVDENKTSMRATSNELFPLEKSNIVFARSYAEAAGFIAAHKAGILFESITSIVKSISITELS